MGGGIMRKFTDSGNYFLQEGGETSAAVNIGKGR